MMRPGGLTVLAVVNFVFGGVNLLGTVSLLGMLALAGSAMQQLGGQGADTFLPSSLALYADLGLKLLTAALLVVSGVGYLKMNKTLGYWMGNAYVLVSMGESLFHIFAVAGMMTLGALSGMVYPLLTLLLLNVTFRRDFV